MRIAVIGAGSMGSAFAALLAQAGADICLAEINPARRSAIAAGVGARTPLGRVTRRLAVAASIRDLPPVDGALVLVESAATVEVAADLRRALPPQGFALTLQNGIGNVETLIAALGPERVLAGSTYVSAALSADGETDVTHIGPTVLGEAVGALSPRAEALAALLARAGLPAEASANAMGAIWLKFALNCALNPLSAITGLRPGEVERHPDMSDLLDAVIAEILAVTGALGLSLPTADPAGYIRDHARDRLNRPSMLQHLEAGRPTEIGSLNAALVARAEECGIPVPVNRAIVALVRGIEARQARGDQPRRGPP